MSVERPPARSFVVEQLRRAFTDPLLLRLGLVQTVLYLGLRANSTFLPIYALSIGINPAQVGLLLSTQVGATLLVQPAAGRLADRLGPTVIVAGLLLLAAGLPLMVMVDHFLTLATLGVALGAGEGLVTPAINAALTEPVEGRRCGSLLGMLDSMDNVGKALGPIVAGLLISVLGFVGAFSAIAALVAASAALLWTAGFQPGPGRLAPWYSIARHTSSARSTAQAPGIGILTMAPATGRRIVTVAPRCDGPR